MFVAVSSVSIETFQSLLLAIIYKIKNYAYADVIAVHLSVHDHQTFFKFSMREGTGKFQISGILTHNLWFI